MKKIALFFIILFFTPITYTKNIQKVQQITDQWINKYNNEQPHYSLGNLTPYEYVQSKKNSTFELY